MVFPAGAVIVFARSSWLTHLVGRLATKAPSASETPVPTEPPLGSQTHAESPSSRTSQPSRVVARAVIP
jgi:hypothetical protein